MSLKNFSLLFVEDDTQTQEFMKIILQDDVQAFYQAYNGNEGLEIFKEKQPDIIITDIGLPKLSGLNMAKEIRKIDKNIPILITSAFDERENLLAALNMGIEYFICKPLDTEILFNELEKIAKVLQDKKDLLSIAHYDLLTQIPNRHLFNIKFEQLLSKSKRHNKHFTLFFIDLNKFKAINDTYGHASGDIVLTSVAKNIKKTIRNEDIFARLSGDEFAILVEDLDCPKNIEEFIQKMLHAVEMPINLNNDTTVQISCSIGYSRYPHDSTTKEELLHKADMAMYEKKSSR